MDVVKARGLSKIYGTRKVVDGLDLEIEKGSIFGFLGPNGAGKTTTIRMLLGLVRPTEGEVALLGRDVRSHRSEIAKKISAIVETPTFFPYMTAIETLRTYSDYSQINASKNACLALLEKCGLEGAARKRVDTYSMGMKQRLGIAVALLNDPDLIFLDEPTNGLDPSGIHDVRNLMLELARDGKSIFISSHILSEVEQVCDAISIIDKGRVVASGNTETLLTSNRTVIKAEPVERVEAILAEHFPNAVLETDGDAIIVSSRKEDTPEMIASLAARGVKIYEVFNKSTTLEDYFHQVINLQ